MGECKTKNNPLMAFTYFKPSFRSLWKKKVITSINILGLSLGISAALVIYLIVQYDFSFDRYEPARDRTFRVVTHSDAWDNAGMPVPFQRALTGVSGIEVSTQFLGMNDFGTKVSIPQGNNKAARLFKNQEKLVYADAGFFSFFPHQWLAGNPAASLKDPYQLVLTESLARTYFPGLTTDQVVGRTVLVNDSITTVVSGIVKDRSEKSDFDFHGFIAQATIPASHLKDNFQWDQWGSINSANQTLVRLLPGVKPSAVEQQVAGIFKAHPSGFDKISYELQPLSDIHFNEKFEGKASKSTLVSLMLLAAFILLLASINFINLSTAQASERAKEIGMRKILGSSKGQLVIRYLNETFLLTVISAVFSLLIAPLLIKGFADFMPAGLDTWQIWQPHVWLFLLLLIAVVGFLSGIYPALVLTGTSPLMVTRSQPGSSGHGSHRAWLRKTLTVSQFVIAQVFIIGVLVVDSQIHFAMNKNMGFRKDAIVNFYIPFDFGHPSDKKFALENKLRTIPEIQAVCLGNSAPAMGGFMTTDVTYHDGKKEIKLPVHSRDGDTGFISLYNIRLLAGRNVLPSDSNVEYLVNETLARKLGFQHPADAVGHSLDGGDKPRPIVGVMADFNLQSVRSAIQPLIFTYNRNGYVMHVALYSSPDSWKAAIAKMQVAWKSVYPDQDFDYNFLDKTIENFYERDLKLSKLLTWAAGVAILISCLGLLGLVIFTANQRIKEIGIRKVLGASVAQIIALLSGDLVRLVAIAFVIAVPFAWWAAHQWLQNFAYHAELSWWLFAIGGVTMLAIALLILSLRAGKAALANPVNCLRTE
jgi:putative ABC transport system permease protein